MLNVVGGGVFDTAHVKRKRAMYEESLCKHCKMKKAFRYCTPMQCTIGSECEKNVVLIKGVDFVSVLQRLDAIERYIAQHELEHCTRLPPELCRAVSQFL